MDEIRLGEKSCKKRIHEPRLVFEVFDRIAVIKREEISDVRITQLKKEGPERRIAGHDGPYAVKRLSAMQCARFEKSQKRVEKFIQP